jgi:hypothetical protein
MEFLPRRLPFQLAFRQRRGESTYLCARSERWAYLGRGRIGRQRQSLRINLYPLAYP